MTFNNKNMQILRFKFFNLRERAPVEKIKEQKHMEACELGKLIPELRKIRWKAAKSANSEKFNPESGKTTWKTAESANPANSKPESGVNTCKNAKSANSEKFNPESGENTCKTLKSGVLMQKREKKIGNYKTGKILNIKYSFKITKSTKTRTNLHYAMAKKKLVMFASTIYCVKNKICNFVEKVKYSTARCNFMLVIYAILSKICKLSNENKNNRSRVIFYGKKACNQINSNLFKLVKYSETTLGSEGIDFKPCLTQNKLKSL